MFLYKDRYDRINFSRAYATKAAGRAYLLSLAHESRRKEYRKELRSAKFVRADNLARLEGKLGNCYGNLTIYQKDSRYYWAIGDHSSEMSQEISKSLYDSIREKFLRDLRKEAITNIE